MKILIDLDDNVKAAIDDYYSGKISHIGVENGFKLLEAVKNGTSISNKEPRWIKCSDNLPDMNVDVFGTEKDYRDVVKVTRMRTVFNDAGWEWVLTDDISGTNYYYKPDEIIAWMPLPEAYKEGEI